MLKSKRIMRVRGLYNKTETDWKTMLEKKRVKLVKISVRIGYDNYCTVC